MADNNISTQFTLLKSQENGNAVYTQPLVAPTYREEDEDLNLRQLWTIVKHRVRLISTIAVGITTLVCVWTFTKTPTYQGKFRLLIGEPISSQGLTDVEDRMMQEALGKNDEIDYDTQIEVLRSPSILNPIIEQIVRKYPDVEYDDLISEKNPLSKLVNLKKPKS